MRLSEVKKHHKYFIESVEGGSEYVDKFNKLGFFPGEVVELRRKAPIFGSPMIFQIGYGQYVLTKTEAELVHVSEADSE